MAKEREKLKRKIAVKMMKAYDKYHGTKFDQKLAEDIEVTCFYPQAEAAINVMGIEVVSNKTKPISGDVIRHDNGKVKFLYLDDDCPSEGKIEIVRRNHQPVINIDNKGE